MNRNKVQLEICKVLLKNGYGSVWGCELKKGKMAIGFGPLLFVLEEDEIVIDRGKIKHTEIGGFLSDDKGDVTIAPTERALIRDDEVYCEYEGDDTRIYIPRTLAKWFEGLEFLSHGEEDRTLIRDLSGEIVGAILPSIRVGEKENALGI